MAHVVIVGGGFGGLAVAKELGNRRGIAVTLIDRRNFHLFQPLLYQVATGGLSPADICAPLRSVLAQQKNIRTLMGEVTGFDLSARKVLVDGEEIPFDSLVVAAGARHHYFGHPEWEPLAPGLKTIEDATEIRSRILRAFEAAEREPDAARRRALLTFVIVGGGPTGVELAGTLGEIANDTLRQDFRSFRSEEARILLLEAGDRILKAFPPDLSAAAEKSLLSLGVRARAGVGVVSMDADGVTLSNGERLDSKTVLWAAGVAASPLGALLGTPLDRAGRVLVDDTCGAPGYPGVYVIGDMAANQTNPLPGVAPVAMQQGDYVGRAILARLDGREPDAFVYLDKGNLATIGRHAAIADFGSFQITGWFAWVLWLFIHIMYLVGFRNRIQVLVHWAFQYMTFNRGARLITYGRG